MRQGKGISGNSKRTQGVTVRVIAGAAIFAAALGTSLSSARAADSKPPQLLWEIPWAPEVLDGAGSPYSNEIVESAEGQDEELEGSVGPGEELELEEMAGEIEGVSDFDLEQEGIDADPTRESGWEVNYFGILYGPGILNPGQFQPSVEGTPDPVRPVQLKNFLGFTYHLSDSITVSPTAYWLYRPMGGEGFELMDPFLRIGHNKLIDLQDWHLYADVRVHFGVTDSSRSTDLLFGVQAFQALTYTWGTERFVTNLYTSARYNHFGKRGFGPDLELYLAPRMAYQASEKLSAVLLCEMGASHYFGSKAFDFSSDGIDLEPGLEWSVSPSLTITPFLNLLPANLAAETTSVGMTLSWNLL